MKRACVILLVLLLSAIPIALFGSQTAKAEPSTMQWTKSYGGTSEDYARALVQTTEGGYALAGYTESFGASGDEAWLVKTDASGNALWNKTYNPIGTWIYALVQPSDGGYALAGCTYSFGAGHGDFWLVKTDISGVVPEFPSHMILAALLVVVSSAVILAKKVPNRRLFYKRRMPNV